MKTPTFTTNRNAHVHPAFWEALASIQRLNSDPSAIRVGPDLRVSSNDGDLTPADLAEIDAHFAPKGAQS
jgi:hypothetical protein